MSMPTTPDVPASPRRVSRTTAIEWTEATWNPTTGCDQISPGCDNCYALTLAKRLKGMGSPKYQTDGDPRTSGPGFGVAVHRDALWLPLRWRQPRRVFVNSMSDLFHDKVPEEFIAEVFAVMAATEHTFQVLTKRHARMRALLNSQEFFRQVHHAYLGLPSDVPSVRGFFWPLPNVWLGVSVEEQKWADIRIPALLQTLAAVRFLSCEPLLGPVDLRSHLAGHCPEHDFPGGFCVQRHHPGVQHLNWVITGGESGPNFRPANPDWFRAIRDQCVEAGVAYLHKQNGGRTPKANGRELDGRTWDEYPEAR